MRQKHWLERKLKKAVLDNQPATPHNTTQFIVNTGHFPTDPYMYDFDCQRFPNDMMNHSMQGSMRNMMLDNFKLPTKTQDNDPCAKDKAVCWKEQDMLKDEPRTDTNLADIKGFKNCFPENAYELMKGRSESDINSISDFYMEPKLLSAMQTPNLQTNQIDIKTLLQEAKNGQVDMENIIKSLVYKIRQKEDIITNLTSK